MLRLVKMLLKQEVGGRAFNSHGNDTVDHGKSWKNHGIVFWNSCGSPGYGHLQLTSKDFLIWSCLFCSSKIASDNFLKLHSL